MSEAEWWCEFCGDERPCECDEQLDDEYSHADIEQEFDEADND